MKHKVIIGLLLAVSIGSAIIAFSMNNEDIDPSTITYNQSTDTLTGTDQNGNTITLKRVSVLLESGGHKKSPSRE